VRNLLLRGCTLGANVFLALSNVGCDASQSQIHGRTVIATLSNLQDFVCEDTNT
jgi:hypothetical protein